MTEEQARQLATRIIDTWPGGTKAYIWRETLETLDVGRAGTAYARLRRDHEHGKAPAPGQFMAVYRALNTTDASTRPDPCGDCDNTGWIQADDHIEHPGTDHERRYSQVRPCRCREGHQRAASNVWTQRT